MRNLKIITYLGLSLIIICSSLNISALLPKNITDDIWTDGKFEGIIIIGESTGNITGMINLGRESTEGVFISTIQMSDEIFKAKGWFRESLLFGFFKKGSILIPILGNIVLQRSSFEATLILPKGSIEATYNASYLPPISGEYSIGVKEYHLIDESREEVLTDEPGDHREFILKVWYPTDYDVEGEWYEYMSEIMFAWLMGRAPIPLPGISETAYKDVMPHGKVDVPIAANTGPLPIVLFEPQLCLVLP